MAGLKVSIFGLKIGKNWGFAPLKFVRGTYEHPYKEINYFKTYCVVWQFRNNQPTDVERSVDGKKTKI